MACIPCNQKQGPQVVLWVVGEAGDESPAEFTKLTEAKEYLEAHPGFRLRRVLRPV